jgi:hypothetical protein
VQLSADDLKRLGVDALWLMPIFKSPFKDSGYDVSDYDAVSPEYGTNQDLEKLLSEAHARKMRVFLDLVFNHTSSEHPWFQESRASKTSPKSDYYVWSDTPSAEGNACGPFNSTFGTVPWTLEPQRNQYYFHRFYPGQPDLNFDNPKVVDETLGVAKRWLEKGVDGFRCDVIGLLFETPVPKDCGALQPKTAEYVKKLRGVLDGFPERAMVAESVLFDTPKPYFGNGKDAFQMAFLFDYGYLWPLAFQSESRSGIDKAFTVAETFPEGAQSALVIGSHDVGRAYAVAQGKEWKQRRAAEIQLTATRHALRLLRRGARRSAPETERVVDAARRGPHAHALGPAAPGHGFTTGTKALDRLRRRRRPVHEPRGRAGATPGRCSRTTNRCSRSAVGARCSAPAPCASSTWATRASSRSPRSDANEAYVVVENLSETEQTVSAEVEGTASEWKLGEGTARREGGKLVVTLPPTASYVGKIR